MTTEGTERPGSAADLSRRMDRIESRQDDQGRQLAALAGTIERVELNQKHGEELNVLRFNALDTAVKSIDGTLARFMDRINAIISGEIKLPQAAQGEALVADFIAWRKDVDTTLAHVSKPEWRDSVDARLDAQDVLNGQVRLLGRLAVFLIGSNGLALIAAVWAFLN